MVPLALVIVMATIPLSSVTPWFRYPLPVTSAPVVPPPGTLANEAIATTKRDKIEVLNVNMASPFVKICCLNNLFD
jgi:hypothetical protein